MTRNTKALLSLHQDLICGKYEEIMDIGKHYGASGFKVNGASGDSGFITILSSQDTYRRV